MAQKAKKISLYLFNKEVAILPRENIRWKEKCVEPMVQQQQRSPLSVFHSYAYADKALCDQLSRHLAPLVRMGMIKEWFEHNISPGANYAEEKEHALKTSNIVLLLISSDYLASEECFREMRFALDNQQ